MREGDTPCNGKSREVRGVIQGEVDGGAQKLVLLECEVSIRQAGRVPPYKWNQPRRDEQGLSRK